MRTDWSSYLTSYSTEAIKDSNYENLKILLDLLKTRFSQREYFDFLVNSYFIDLINANPELFFEKMQMSSDQVKDFLNNLFHSKMMQIRYSNFLKFYLDQGLEFKDNDFSEIYFNIPFVKWVLSLDKKHYKNLNLQTLFLKIMDKHYNVVGYYNTWEEFLHLAINTEWMNPKAKDFYKKAIIVNMPDSALFDQIIETEDFGHLFNVSNRSLKRVMYSKMESKKTQGSLEYRVLDFTMFHKVKDLIELAPHVDQQKLIPFVESLALINSQSEYIDVHNYIEYLKKVSKRLNSFGLSFDPLPFIYSIDLERSHLRDLSVLISSYFSNAGRDSESKARDFHKAIIEKNINSVKKLKVFLQSVVRNDGRAYLDQENILWLDGMTIGKYSVQVPTDSDELTKAGIILKNCVGNGSYGQKINRKESNIVFLKEGKDIVYCFEFKNLDIIQAKGLSNRSAPKSLQIRFIFQLFLKENKTANFGTVEDFLYLKKMEVAFVVANALFLGFCLFKF